MLLFCGFLSQHKMNSRDFKCQSIRVDKQKDGVDTAGDVNVIQIKMKRKKKSFK